MKNIFAILALLVSLTATAQYEIPGDGSIPMPPGCEAQYYYANYCVASNIVPMDLSYHLSESEMTAIAKNPEGIACARASYTWQSCQHYLRSVVQHNISGECRNYWNYPHLQGPANALARERLAMLSAQCGGAFSN